MTSLQGPILIVDDNDAGRYTKAHILRRADFDVFEAADGKTALALLARVRPRLVVLDVNLPDVNGMDLCRRIKQGADGTSTLVLQVSATYVTHADTVKSLDAGADASLVEPIEPTVLIATVRALLRIRQAEDALRHALAMEQTARTAAEAANRMKDEFLATLSHELRSPLGAILTWATLLRSTTPDATQLARGLGAIERNTRHQVKLIEDLLDVSRIISGKMQLDFGPVNIESVVNAAVEAVGPSAKAKSLKLTIDFDTNLRLLKGDAARIRQVVSNLLSNAIKFTPERGHAELRVLQHPTAVEIRVTDNGKGIDPTFLPHVFERFQQADSSSTRPDSGLGIGLAIVRHLAELHGGTVEAASDGQGRGATFIVRLPNHSDSLPSEVAVAEEVAQPPRLPSTPTLLHGVRLLVVDDDADSCEAIVTALRTAGATVHSVNNVKDALAHVATNPVEVLVSDIGMPREDGFALIDRLRNTPAARRIATLALTAYASVSDQRRVLSAGYDAFIAKPAAADDLVAIVTRLADVRHGRAP